jgi:hypothetical protein
MKNLIYSILLPLVFSTISVSCDKNDQLKKPCDSDYSIAVTDQIGRIYLYTLSEPHFYYLGNIVEDTNGVNGGYIPCNGMPEEFQKEGLSVVYSGIDKGSLPDSNDPLFAYINLTKIEKSE